MAEPIVSEITEWLIVKKTAEIEYVLVGNQFGAILRQITPRMYYTWYSTSNNPGEFVPVAVKKSLDFPGDFYLAMIGLPLSRK